MAKKNTIPDIKITIPEPKNEIRTQEQVTIEVLTSVRQLEPEQQNEVVKTVLTELAADRFNSAKAARDASDRAGKNVEVFMHNAVYLEKMLSELKIV
jgi:hypothetical protein